MAWLKVTQKSQIAQKYLVSSFKIQVSGLAKSAESAEIKIEPHMLMKLFFKV